VEEVKALLAIVMCATAALAQGADKRPKIVAPALCGVVTTLSGVPIEKASVAAMWADFGTSTRTDAQGRWNFGSGVGPHWINVQADGFEQFIFDYAEPGKEKDNGADKPAFIRTPKDTDCSKPIYIRLAPKGATNSFVTLDSQKGLQKENKP
jgi:hypothetical protein